MAHTTNAYAYLTLTEIVQLATRRLSQQYGSGVQTYSEDRLKEYIQHKFTILMEEAWWPQFNAWVTTTLDGTTGEPVADLGDTFTRHQDIRAIFVDGAAHPLPRLSQSRNPYNITGSTPRAYEYINEHHKLFRVWPFEATNTIHINGRARPLDYVADDVVMFDSEVLAIGAAWDYAVDDATNPNAIDKLHALFESRKKQLVRDEETVGIMLDPNSQNTSTEWREY